MDFIDEVTFWVHAGRGGNGCASFRCEKYVPKGGPDGGDGGRGGDVVLTVHPEMSTLFDYRHRKMYRAGDGGHGKGKKMTGRDGAAVDLPVPPGTIVKDAGTGEVLADLTDRGQSFTAARGGGGGRGNTHFATPSFQAPDTAEPGRPGESRPLRLELRLLADVGFVGLPNAGKSTLLARISAAKPKIADYPFTTLAPNLGIVRYAERRHFVAADIPGLIAGAHLGRGLGDRFLRHIERTRVLVVLVESVSEDPARDYALLLDELAAFDPALLDKPRVAALSKADLVPPEARAGLPASLGGLAALPFSAHTGEGLGSLLDAVAGLLYGGRA
jgi:GTP-binding protein